jgi:O-antigen ligase/polysaccharide polymerase Wzy-like membrane protein
MSRFRPGSSPSSTVLTPLRPAMPPQAPPVRTLPRFDRPAQLSVPGKNPAGPRPGIVQRIGFWVLCGYLVSAIFNEWALRVTGSKGYLSVITLVLLPILWLVSGATLRGLRHRIGWWWAGFLLLVLMATPFSIWRGGTVTMLVNYIPRSYLLFFYVASLAISFRNCRQLMYVNITVSFMALLTCIVFGTYGEDGRYFVPGGAGFFANANELAMQLLLGITQFVYLFSQQSFVGKFIAMAGIGGSVPYLLRTGSRGCLLGAIAYLILVLYLSRQRARTFVIVAALAAIGVTFAPSAVLHRLMLLTGDEAFVTSSDAPAIASQMTRVGLLKRSIAETISHPLFGVGPGQFPVAVAEEAKARNAWTSWLGTHNSYTQVSSECGIPAFLCYFAVVVMCCRMSLSVWKLSRNRPERADINTLAVALLSGSVVWAVCSLFFHMAYSGTLPFLAGQTVALYFAAEQRGSVSGLGESVLARR